MLKTGAWIAGINDPHRLDLTHHPKTILLRFQIPQGITDKNRITALLGDLLNPLEKHDIIRICQSWAEHSNGFLTTEFSRLSVFRPPVSQLLCHLLHTLDRFPCKRNIVFFIQDHRYCCLGHTGLPGDIRRSYFFLHTLPLTE